MKTHFLQPRGNTFAAENSHNLLDFAILVRLVLQRKFLLKACVTYE